MKLKICLDDYGVSHGFNDECLIDSMVNTARQTLCGTLMGKDWMRKDLDGHIGQKVCPFCEPAIKAIQSGDT